LFPFSPSFGDLGKWVFLRIVHLEHLEEFVGDNRVLIYNNNNNNNKKKKKKKKFLGSWLELINPLKGVGRRVWESEFCFVDLPS